jgi:hypothetical protein
MFNRLASLLNVGAHEKPLVFLVAIIFACVHAGQGMSDNAASALFLLHYQPCQRLINFSCDLSTDRRYESLSMWQLW